MFRGQPGQKVSEIVSQQINWVWWCMPVILFVEGIDRTAVLNPPGQKMHKTI
jgi:hypothetical protein